MAWSALVVVSLAFLSWVPFLYIAVKRQRSQDWITMAAFSVVTVVEIVWGSIVADGPDNPYLGAWAIITWIVAIILIFTRFDAAGTKADTVSYGQPSGKQFLQ
ncbi:hypothetical protein DXZ75_05070 [Streptomyces sp. AcE210]|nr:hypothetical protein DXZ75_05070 [Streptomyces sp. AcE210]